MNEYIKMKDLVGSDFTVISVGDYQWKKWDATTKKMLTSDKWQDGYQKRYRVETDKGILEVSASQLSNMLEGVSKNGKADVASRKFSVKSNGKTDENIRYFINPVFGATVGLDPALKQKLDAQVNQELYPAQPSVELPPALDPDEEIDLSSIPF